jgi:hypothetical protein
MGGRFAGLRLEGFALRAGRAIDVSIWH